MILIGVIWLDKTNWKKFQCFCWCRVISCHFFKFQCCCPCQSWSGLVSGESCRSSLELFVDVYAVLASQMISYYILLQIMDYGYVILIHKHIYIIVKLPPQRKKHQFVNSYNSFVATKKKTTNKKASPPPPVLVPGRSPTFLVNTDLGGVLRCMRFEIASNLTKVSESLSWCSMFCCCFVW